MEVATFEDAAAWESWLAAHHGSHAGAWLKIAKRASGAITVTVTDALDVALCYGWIDSRRKALDESFFLQRYSRRRPGSSWSRVNIGRIEALLAAGRMRPPGLAEVSAAKADGRWDAAYESQRTATVPPDLSAALDRSDRARRAFDWLGRTERYAVILPLLKATAATTRAACLRRVIETLEARQ